ncbi:hypothetical protein BC830DRAFT_931967 [Chytriomyces sp. MP71]|nr:hypothetical protein BC830DRAFT_931967 [Chytriomyces sp. MP71]
MSQEGDHLVLKYSGVTVDRPSFRAHYAEEPESYYLGTSNVIPAFDEAVTGMCVKERRKVNVPAHLAFGEEGLKQGDEWFVPPNSDMIYYIELDELYDETDKRVLYPEPPVETEVKVLRKVPKEECTRSSKVGDWLVVNYHAVRFFDGELFASTLDGNNPPLKYELGKGHFPGWDDGLDDMCVGELRRLIVPADRGYGEVERTNLPAGSPLIFEVELLEINDTSKSDKKDDHEEL